MNIYEHIYEYIWIYIWFFWFEHSASTNTCSVEHMNASDKLIDNNWIYYIAGSCFLIHVPKRPTYTRPHVSADIFENGVISPRFSKKYASIWNVFKSFFAPKSADTTQQKLRPLLSVRCRMNDIILFENHRFRHCFPLPTRKRQFGVSKNLTLVTVFENLALRFFCVKFIAELHPRAKRVRGRSSIAKEMW